MVANSTETRKIAALTVNSFVRTQLNLDRVVFLGNLMEAGTDLDPIEITQDGRVVDGRHRIEAHNLLDKTDIRCLVTRLTEEVDIISRAYQANLGSALPPTREDTEHTIIQLIERGVQHRKLGEFLGLPPSLVRAYIKEVQRKINHTKLVRAAAAVTEDGRTVSEAARIHDVDLEKLKEFLGGSRRRRAAAFEPRRDLTKLYKSSGVRQGRIVEKALDRLDDGDLTARQVVEMLDHIDHLQKQSARRVADWRRRFEAMVRAPQA